MRARRCTHTPTATPTSDVGVTPTTLQCTGEDDRGAPAAAAPRRRFSLVRPGPISLSTAAPP